MESYIVLLLFILLFYSCSALDSNKSRTTHHGDHYLHNDNEPDGVQIIYPAYEVVTSLATTATTPTTTIGEFLMTYLHDDM